MRAWGCRRGWMSLFLLGLWGCSDDLSDVRRPMEMDLLAHQPEGHPDAGQSANTPNDNQVEAPMSKPVKDPSPTAPTAPTAEPTDAAMDDPPVDTSVIEDADCGTDNACPTGYACNGGTCTPDTLTCAGTVDECGVCEGTGKVTYFADSDSDGFGDAAGSERFCPDAAPTTGYAMRDGDCNDHDPSVHPDAAEVCDGAGVDENCDGDVDAETWYADADGDGYGDPNNTRAACSDPTTADLAFVNNSRDCNDADAEAFPQAGYCLIQRFKSPLGPDDYDLFGFWSTVVGDRVLLSAPAAGPLPQPNNCLGAGSIFEYRIGSDGRLSPVGAAITSSVSGGDACFGFNTAYDAGTGVLAVGVEHATGLDAAGRLVPDAGAVELFERQADGSWKTVAVISPQDDTGANDSVTGSWFGDAVGFHNGDLLATRRTNVTTPGALYTFRKSGNGWSQIERIVDPDESGPSNFGYTLAVNGDLVFVGAPGKFASAPCSGSSDTMGCRSGGAYTLQRSSDGHHVMLAQSWALEPGDLTPGAGFAREILPFGDGAVIVSPYALSPSKSGALGRTGAVYFASSTASPSAPWALEKASPSIEGIEEIGPNIATAAGRVIVGAPNWRESLSGNTIRERVGCALVFSRDKNGDWQSECLLPPPSVRREGLRFAFGVHAIRDDVLVVSALASDAVDTNPDFTGDRRAEQFVYRWMGP